MVLAQRSSLYPNAQDGQVTFRWRDSAHRNQQKLRALQFLRRFLLHILPQCIFRTMYISESLSATAGSDVSVQGV